MIYKRNLTRDFVRKYSDVASVPQAVSSQNPLDQYESYRLLQQLQLDGPMNRKYKFKHRSRRVALIEKQYKQLNQEVDDKFNESKHISFSQNLSKDMAQKNPDLILAPWGSNSRIVRKEVNNWHLGVSRNQLYFRFLLEFYLRDYGKSDLTRKGRYLSSIINFHMTHKALENWPVNATSPVFPKLFEFDKDRKVCKLPNEEQNQLTLRALSQYQRKDDNFIQQACLGSWFDTILETIKKVGRDVLDTNDDTEQRKMLLVGKQRALQKAMYLNYLENNLQKGLGIINTLNIKLVKQENYLYSARFIAHRMCQMLNEKQTARRIISKIKNDIETEMSYASKIEGAVLQIKGIVNFSGPSKKKVFQEALGDVREFKSNTRMKKCDFFATSTLSFQSVIGVKVWVQYKSDDVDLPKLLGIPGH